MAKILFEPLEVVDKEGNLHTWPLYGPEGQPIMALPQGNMRLARAEREAPNLHTHTVLESATDAPLNKYGLPEGTQLGESRGERLYRRERQETQWAREISVPNNGQIIPGPQPPELDGPARFWTITVLPRTFNALDVITMNVDYALGGVNFHKEFLMTPNIVAKPFAVQGRRITISFVSPVSDTARTNVLDVGVEPHQFDDTVDRHGAVWLTDRKVAGAYTDYTNFYQGQSIPNNLKGIGFRCLGVLLTAAAEGTVIYPCLYDFMGPGDPPANTPSIMTCGAGLVAVGENWDWGDEFSPQLRVVNGLTLALSTSPDIYVAQAGAAKWCYGKLGF